jgi:hypothetical protein
MVTELSFTDSVWVSDDAAGGLSWGLGWDRESGVVRHSNCRSVLLTCEAKLTCRISSASSFEVGTVLKLCAMRTFLSIWVKLTPLFINIKYSYPLSVIMFLIVWSREKVKNSNIVGDFFFFDYLLELKGAPTWFKVIFFTTTTINAGIQKKLKSAQINP